MMMPPWPVLVWILLLLNIMIAFAYKANLHFGLLRAMGDKSVRDLSEFLETMLRPYNEHWVLYFPWFGLPDSPHGTPEVVALMKRTRKAIKYSWLSLALLVVYPALLLLLAAG